MFFAGFAHKRTEVRRTPSSGDASNRTSTGKRWNCGAQAFTITTFDFIEILYRRIIWCTKYHLLNKYMLTAYNLHNIHDNLWSGGILWTYLRVKFCKFLLRKYWEGQHDNQIKNIYIRSPILTPAFLLGRGLDMNPGLSLDTKKEFCWKFGIGISTGTEFWKDWGLDFGFNFQNFRSFNLEFKLRFLKISDGDTFIDPCPGPRSLFFHSYNQKYRIIRFL